MMTMMQVELPAAVEENLISLLQKCKQTKDAAQAKRLHARMREQDLDSHPLLGNYLVHALVECGSLPDAQLVFDRLHLHHRDIISWTSLISAYINHGDTHRAFHLYHSMLDEPLSAQPNRVTYLALLNACSRSKDVDSGRRLHAEIIKRGLEGYISGDSSAVVGNTLVDMYSKWGLLEEARQLFEGLPVRDVVSWNALITGYAEHGDGEEARICFRRMQFDGISPSYATFLCSLKACGSGKAIDLGHEVHNAITKRGWETELYVGSTLVDMYTKCGSLAEARSVFNKLPLRNAISWAAMIAGYMEHGIADEVLSCVQQMQLEGVSPDPVLFVCSLKGCGNVGALETGRKIHSEVTKHGLERELYLCSTVVDLYGKCGSHVEARHVFDTLPDRDIVAWNALIASYADNGLGEEAGKCVLQMQADGVFPDSVTFLCSLKACGLIGALQTGQETHSEVTKRGFEIEQSVGNTLVDIYTKCGLLADAQQIFDRLPVQDKVSWNALLSGFAEHGFDEEVLDCFKKMQLLGVSADPVTFIGCLKASGSIGALEVGREIHAEIRKAGLERDPFVASTLLGMYGKCGSVTEAREVFDKLPVQGVVAWTAMIKAYGENHDGHMAVQCFEDMRGQCVNPDSMTFSCLLAACSHANLASKGQEYFKLMCKYEIKPTMDHHACMVDLLARSGHVYEAERFVAAMQCPPSSLMLMALLSACKIYGKVELGERCFQHLVEVKQEDASAYLLMADMYASLGRWCDASRVDEMRKEKGALKKPGSAVIEVKKETYEFVVSDNKSDYILRRFEIPTIHMKDEGYVPILDLVSRHTYNGEEELVAKPVIH